MQTATARTSLWPVFPRAGESGAAISFVTEAERGQLKAIERFIKKSIRVDRDHPFHSAFADQKSGKADEGLPTAPRPMRGDGGRIADAVPARQAPAKNHGAGVGAGGGGSYSALASATERDISGYSV